MIESMRGKVAVVTGAAQGIGCATAMQFARHGASVVISDLESQRSAGMKAVEAIEMAGGVACFTTCDVTDEGQVEALIQTTVDRFGRLDYACNNAGYQCPASLTSDMSNEDWDRVMAVNLKGVWWCMKYEIRQMLRQGGGAIVNIASLAGLVGIPCSVSYVASKHAVIGLTKTAALEFARQGIRVNAVCPALVMTRMVRDFVGNDESALARIREMAPVGRPGQPEEIASAVLWLCSDGAGFTTGHALSVDGGAAAA